MHAKLAEGTCHNGPAHGWWPPPEPGTFIPASSWRNRTATHGGLRHASPTRNKGNDHDETPHPARRHGRPGRCAAAPRPAQAQAAKTKIVWWHAMTAALGEQVTRIADTFNQSQTAVEVQAIYKGGYADLLNADHRRLARRPGAAPRADLRGRHRHHAGRRQGGEAGVGAVEGNRRHHRPEDLHPGGARLLQPGRRADGVDAVQLLHRRDVVQQGRVPQGRPRSGQAAGDLGRGGEGGAGDQSQERRRDPDAPAPG